MYDLAIIGGGPGGYVAALRGAQLGAKVILIEKNRVGGTCLHKGCIPTKTFYTLAKTIYDQKKALEFGLKVECRNLDLLVFQQKKNEIIGNLEKGIKSLLNRQGVKLVTGKAEFVDRHTLKIISEKEESIIQAENIIIASGSESMRLTELGYNGKNVITSDEILEIKDVPKTLIIVGGGVVGCEFAAIFQALGTNVSIIELESGLLPFLDQDLGKYLRASFRKQGIGIHLKTRVMKITSTNDEVTVELENGTSLTAEKVLLALGRVYRSDDLGLDLVGVGVGSKGEITVDGNYETLVKGIYAIGDINGQSLFAHSASAQGIAVVERIIKGKGTEIAFDKVPCCIFTHPEIASVGMSEEEVKRLDIPYNQTKAPFLALGKAQALGLKEGFIKVISSKEDNKVLGIHIYGEGASNLIGEAVVSLANKLTVHDVLKGIHPHPTLTEGFQEAMEALDGKPLHYF